MPLQLLRARPVRARVLRVRPRKVALSARGIVEPVQSEEDVLGAIRGLLEANGARVHRIVERIPWGKTTSTPGMPDLVGWFPRKWEGDFLNTVELARVFFIEVKRPGGKLRPAQTLWLNEARLDGIIAFMADSVEKMVEEFSKYGIRINGLPKGKQNA